MRNGTERKDDCWMKAYMDRRAWLKAAVYGGLAVSALASGAMPAVAQPSSGNSAVDPGLFDMLPNWVQADAATPMTMGDLVNLKDASVAFLKHVENGRAAGIENELRQYIESHCKPGESFNAGKASGLYLLLRIIFELPDLVPATEWQSFGGWYSVADERAVKEKQESDDFHPSWPIYIARISNKLYVKSSDVPSPAASQPVYRIWDEYQYMRGKFKFRTSDYISGLEFIFIAGEP